jgi:hypothetical protein
MLNPISRLSILLLSSLFVMGCGSTGTTESEVSTESTVTEEPVVDVAYEEINDEPSADYFSSFANDDFALRSLIGEWEAISGNHRAICGDMTIDTAVISFENKGDVTFEILLQESSYWIIEISENVDAGLFMRLGPITQTEEDTEEKSIEVAYYESEEMAIAPRKNPEDNANSWGMYAKKLK